MACWFVRILRKHGRCQEVKTDWKICSSAEKSEAGSDSCAARQSRFGHYTGNSTPRPWHSAPAPIRAGVARGCLPHIRGWPLCGYTARHALPWFSLPTLSLFGLLAVAGFVLFRLARSVRRGLSIRMQVFVGMAVLSGGFAAVLSVYAINRLEARALRLSSQGLFSQAGPSSCRGRCAKRRLELRRCRSCSSS